MTASRVCVSDPDECALTPDPAVGCTALNMTTREAGRAMALASRSPLTTSYGGFRA